MPSPRPPYSSGMSAPSHPPSANALTNSHGYSPSLSFMAGYIGRPDLFRAATTKTARLDGGCEHRREGGRRVGSRTQRRNLASRREAGKHPALRLRRTAAHRLRHRKDRGRFSDNDRCYRWITGVHRPRSTRRCDSDAAIGSVFAWRDAILRDHRPRGVRAPQWREGSRPVPADHSQPIPDLRHQGLPPDVAGAIEHAMARDPSDRPASAAEFGEQLRNIQRSHRASVDDMAHRVELGVESRKAPAVPSARRAHTSATPTPPTPATKYRPPVPLRSLVARDRLHDLLRAAGRRRLILINAPSGYGKSTLAAQWRQLLMSDGVAVAWLTVDDDDNNNTVWFLAHLLESIRTIRPALAASLTQVLEEHGDDSARYVLTSPIDGYTKTTTESRSWSTTGTGYLNPDDRRSGFPARTRLPPPAARRNEPVACGSAVEQTAAARRARRNRL